MSVKDITITIKAEIGAFQRDMAAAAAAAKKTADATEKVGTTAGKSGKGFDTLGKSAEGAGKQAESGIGRLTQTVQKHKEVWDKTSTAMVVGGAAITGALALSAKEAITWESAFAGVKKTVDDTPEGFAKLSDELRGLARTLPATHTEIAGVAEAAGQLGVARGDITGFTKTMIDLSESTNLTADEAATNIAQISNVMGTMEREGVTGVQRFGSALVALGNDGASTEVEIVKMAQRIAGAGASLGASEADVLALSNTLASMGVRAELGGGVATRVLLKMRTAVDEGGESVQAFADVAGTSAEEFAEKFRTSPMEALQLVAEGIDRTNDAGGNLTATLKDMGIKGTEEMQVMLALANSGDLLTRSLELGATAWEENTALVEEAAQRYETTESKIKIAWNNIKDVAITAGGVILPVIASMATAVSELAGWFGDLPGPVQTTLTVLGGVAGVGLLAAGGFMKIVSVLGDLVPKMAALGMDTPTATRAVSGFGKVLGGVTLVGAGILAGKIAIEAINDAVRAGKPDVEAYFNLLATGGGVDMIEALGLGEGNRGKLFPESAKRDMMDFYGTLTVESANAKQAIEQLGNTDGLSGLTGWFSKNLSFGDVRAATEDALQLQEAMRGISRAFDMGESDMGIAALNDFKNELQLTDAEIGTLINSTPELKSALMNLATEGGIQIDPNDELGLVDLALGRIKGSAPAAADAMGGAGDAGEKAGDKWAKAAESVDKFYDSMVNAGMIIIGENEAIRGLQETINSVSKTLEENGKVVDKNGEAIDKSSEKYLNSAAGLDSLAASTLSVIDPMRQAGATTSEMADQIAHGREEFIEQAKVMGYSQKAAEAYADKLGLIPGDVYVNFDSNTDSLAGKISEIHALVESTPDGSITITENSPVVRAALENLGYVVTELPDGTIQVSETGTDKTGKKIDDAARKKRIAKINAEAITKAAEGALKQAERDRKSTIFASASTATAEGQLNTAARDRTSVIRTRVVTTKVTYESTGQGGSGGITRASGGSVFGPGTETSDSIPALLSNNEHVWSAKEVRGAGGHGMIERMRAMARAGALPAFKTGGRVGRAEDRISDLQKQIRRVPSNKANRTRKANLQDQLQDARAELKIAKQIESARTKSQKAAAKRADDRAKAAKKRADEARKKAAEQRKLEKERGDRIWEEQFQLKRDMKRGDITDAFTSGSGMSQIDQLFEQSKNKDLSRGRRNQARSTGYKLENQLLGLERQAVKLETQLDKATDARDRLLEAKNSAASVLRNEWSLDSVMEWDTLKNGPLTAKDIAGQAKAKVAQYRAFAKKIEELRKKGYSTAVIQDVISLGVNEGTYAADALLGGSKNDMNDINRAYGNMDRYTDQTGNELTKSMHKGGLDAAEGLVRGLEAKTKNVEDAFYKLGKDAERAFKRALGINSPSKVFYGRAEDTIDGAILSVNDNKSRLFDTYEELGDGVAKSFQPATNTRLMLQEALRFDQPPVANAARSNSSGPNIQLTMYNPVAEPTSKTIERASQLAQL